LDPLSAPLVQHAAALAHALRRVRQRAHGDLRPSLIHNPDRMRLSRPVDSKVVAHSSSFRWPHRLAAEEHERQVRLIPALRGATFSLTSRTVLLPTGTLFA